VKKKLYEFFEHTADIGIKVRAATLKVLFHNSALAMFSIIAKKRHSTKPLGKPVEIKQEADNLEELFINWLNELLSLSATKELIFSDFKIQKLTERKLQATIIGSPVENFELNTEIKAATYHALKINKDKSGWQAEVIFDV